MTIFNWIAVICEEATDEYKSGNARGLKVTTNVIIIYGFHTLTIQLVCLDGVLECEIHVPYCTSPVLRMMIRNKPNWNTAKVIELDFKKYEMRTVKIFLDGLYGCGTEDADIEDLVKLVRLVDGHGSDKERD